MKRITLALCIGLTMSLMAACGSSSDSSSSESNAVGSYKPGVLTVVLPDFPYPGFIEGDDVTKPTGGYYVALADKIGKKLNLKVKYNTIDFTAMIGGQAKNFDIVADSLSILPERVKKFDMTSPVFSDHLGVMTKKDVDVSTVAQLRSLKFGACGACDASQFINQKIKPTVKPLGFDQDLQKYTAVKNGQIDGAVGEIPTILAKLRGSDFAGFKAACAFPATSDYGWIMNKGSKLYPKVQAMLKGWAADGTLAALQKKWVFPTMGGVDPSSVPACPSLG